MSDAVLRMLLHLERRLGEAKACYWCGDTIPPGGRYYCQDLHGGYYRKYIRNPALLTS